MSTHASSRSGIVSRARRFALAAVLLAPGCAAIDPTEMVVLVDTDLPIGPQMSGVPVGAGEIREITFRVECIADPGDPPCRLRMRDEAVFVGLTQSYVAPSLGTQPPFYFVLERDEPGLTRTIRVDATARLGPEAVDEETIVASASARTVEGEARVMIVALREECINVPCSGETACTLGGACAPITQSPPVWPGTCAEVPRPGLPSRECEDVQFRE